MGNQNQTGAERFGEKDSDNRREDEREDAQRQGGDWDRRQDDDDRRRDQRQDRQPGVGQAK